MYSDIIAGGPGDSFNMATLTDGWMRLSEKLTLHLQDLTSKHNVSI